MSPVWIRAPSGGRAERRATTCVAALVALLAALASPAFAIVGGAEEAGPLSRSAVMVLSSKGGVCSAVVVAPDALLTAAHCATGAGDYRVHYRNDAGEPVLLDPAALAVHPGYDRGAIAGRRRSIDLALVRLASPLPARFTTAVLSADLPLTGDALQFGGFGVAREGDGRSTGVFRAVDLEVVAPYGRSTILVWAKGFAGQGACQGDSGGPIAASSSVVAVSTWATGEGRRGCGAISQGVLVGPQRMWIDTTLAGWGREAAWR